MNYEEKYAKCKSIEELSEIARRDYEYALFVSTDERLKAIRKACDARMAQLNAAQ